MKNKKVVWIMVGVIIVLIILFVIFIGLSISSRVINLEQKCTSDTDCPNNAFCDISHPGGMGPNGYVSGQSYGSQKCIYTCNDNSDCSGKQCKEYEIVGGDIIIRKKGCATN